MAFQDFLPSTTPRYQYKGYKECLRLLEEKYDELKKFEHEFEEDRLECAYNPYIIMDIDERSFLECFVESGEKLLTLSWESYDHVHKSTLLKTESTQHAVTGGAFNTIFSAWARGVTDPGLSNTSTRIVNGSTRDKKADISWTPTYPPNGRSDLWPTFIGEVTWSESRPKLIQDVEFWLQDPITEVQAAITISILRGRIKVEKWESDNQHVWPVQTMQIFRNPPPGHPQVTGSLEIQFSDVFLRQPTATERNFILTPNDMHELATHTWAFQYRNRR